MIHNIEKLFLRTRSVGIYTVLCDFLKIVSGTAQTRPYKLNCRLLSKSSRF